MNHTLLQNKDAISIAYFQPVTLTEPKVCNCCGQLYGQTTIPTVTDLYGLSFFNCEAEGCGSTLVVRL